MENNTLSNFKRCLKWAGIEPNGTLSIHTLRKSCGQNWANHLPPNVTKELMGHSNIATTMKYYAQVDKEHRIKAAAVIDRLVLKGNAGTYNNEAEGTRTLNLRIDSPMQQNDKSCHSKELQQDKEGAYKPAYKNISETAENKTQIDTRKLPTELAEIVTIWHELPEHIKAAIKALAQTHYGEKVNERY